MAENDPQTAVADQGDEMADGYRAAAHRIELEIGEPLGRVLDLGCNTGAGMEALSGRWWRVQMFGLEPSAALAQKARDRGFMVAANKAEDMVFPDGYFDLVFSRHSLEHVADRTKAIDEIRRVLYPGGRLYVQAPIEPGGSPNALHVSPFVSLEEFRASFPGFRELYWGPQETVAELILEKL